VETSPSALQATIEVMKCASRNVYFVVSLHICDNVTFSAAGSDRND
jgi:hypothetical protein